MVLASSASQRELDVLRKAIGADDVVDETTSADDAGTSKPDPDILVVALRRAGLSAQRAVLVGDAVWDVVAATRAGLRCIGLACGGISAAELREAGAVETYEDPAALRAALDRSPIGELSRL